MLGAILRGVSGFVNAGMTHFQHLLQSHGIIAFVAASLMKGLMILYIIPAEAVTPAYVLLRAETALDVALIALVAATAILAGNTVFYLLVRRLGERFVLYRKYGGTPQWTAMETIFKRHGRFSMFFLRLAPFVNGWVTVLAALVRFRMRDFLIFSFFGFLAYEMVLGYAAFYGVRLGAMVRYETLAPIINFLTGL